MPNYLLMLDEMRCEYDRLMAERNHIHGRLAALEKAMEAMNTLVKGSGLPSFTPPPLPPDEDAGFTENVRAVLKANPLRPVTAVEVRDTFMDSDPNGDPKVLLIHAHNTLKRLHKQGEVEESDAFEGRKGYKLKPPPAYNHLADLASMTRDKHPEISSALAALAEKAFGRDAETTPDRLAAMASGSPDPNPEATSALLAALTNPPDPNPMSATWAAIVAGTVDKKK
jgi:hypothetical protein